LRQMGRCLETATERMQWGLCCICVLLAACRGESSSDSASAAPAPGRSALCGNYCSLRATCNPNVYEGDCVNDCASTIDCAYARASDSCRNAYAEAAACWTALSTCTEYQAAEYDPTDVCRQSTDTAIAICQDALGPCTPATWESSETTPSAAGGSGATAETGGEASFGCAEGLTLCDTSCANLDEDRFNCGQCGLFCGSDQVCVEGQCQCAPGAQLCGVGPDPSTQTWCVDTAQDETHCGACGVVCGSRAVCRDGNCTCPDHEVDCGQGCVDLRSDAANCGACGAACANGLVCSEGACANTCAVGLSQCVSDCAQTDTSAVHCGSCHMPCQLGQVCEAGMCVCPAEQEWCTLPYGCVNTSNDASHCGMCGLPCLPGEICLQGTCSPG